MPFIYLSKKTHQCCSCVTAINGFHCRSLRVNIGMWEDRRFTDELKGVYFSRQENGDKIDVDK